MQKSQTPLKKVKSWKHGTKSKFEFLLQAFKSSIIERLELRIEGFKNSAIADHSAIIVIHNEIITVLKKDLTIDDLYRSLIKVAVYPNENRDSGRLIFDSQVLKNEVLLDIDRFIVNQFKEFYEWLWYGALISRSVDEWKSLLSDTEENFKYDHQIFKFYWRIFLGFRYMICEQSQEKTLLETIARGFIETNLRANLVFLTCDHTRIYEVNEWLTHCVLLNRIRIRVNCSRRELTDFIRRVWIMRERIKISDVDALICSHFVCNDSGLSSVFRPYEVSIHQKMRFVLLMRLFFDSKPLFEFGDNVSTVQNKQALTDWLEFAFNGEINRYTIDYYFNRKECCRNQFKKIEREYSSALISHFRIFTTVNGL